MSLEGAALEGSMSASVALVEYADFRCPVCGHFARETLPAIRKRYVETGKVLLAFRHFPLAAMHPFAVRAAEAAACAGQQRRFWPMHDLLYQAAQDSGPPDLQGAAMRLGLDRAAFAACLRAGTVLGRIEIDAGEGLVLGVSATPTLFFGTVEGGDKVQVMERMSSEPTFVQLQEILDRLLRSASH